MTVDITDRKIAEERQALLAREVDHRAKNALALVQSIVRLTRASDIAAYTTAVEGRIRALSRAHTILSLSRWQGADMRGLVEEELAPYRTGETAKVETSGPNVSLQPAAAQSLALALHELVTNAAKYGALSSMSGRVHLAWELNPGTLVLKWTESGGPRDAGAVVPGLWHADHHRQHRRTACRPDRVRLASRRAAMRPVGPARRHDAGEGPQWESVRRCHGRSRRPVRITVAGNRVMIVEDEALVAMALRESLG